MSRNTMLEYTMPYPLDQQTLTGAHPTTSEFVDQLAAWGFTRRRAEGVHLVFRGPRGGTLRVLRSLLGRADAGLVEKAARIAGIGVEQFWAGPPRTDEIVPSPTARPEPPRRRVPAHDRIISLVMAAHTMADRPLGFDQVVELCRGRVTRLQVRTASSALCRDGDLDRIRSGVYQWAGGLRALPQMAVHAQDLAIVRRQRKAPHSATKTTSSAADQTARVSAAELFGRLFPTGVQMTAELLTDFEQWAQLTEKLAAHADAS